MNTMMLIVDVTAVHGAPMRGESVTAAYARVWKQRPGVSTLGGFPTDNSTGVSAAESRRL